jgi:hypothetical protein
MCGTPKKSNVTVPIGRNSLADDDSCTERVVKVVITDDHFAVLDPPVLSLKPLLEYRQRSFQPGGPHGYREVVQEVMAWKLDIKGRLAFPAGLLPRAMEQLCAEGYGIEIDDQRTKARKLQPNLMIADSSDARDCARLVAIRENLLGQIEITSVDDAVELSATIAEFYPNARILVAVATRQQAQRVRFDLHERLGEKVGLWAAGVSRKQCRCVVTTVGSMGHDTDWDILLLPFGEEMLGDEAVYRIASQGFGRRYAFIQAGQHHDRLAQMRLEQIAGKIISHVAKPRLQTLVAMLPTPTCNVGKAKTAVAQTRKLYWTNHARNEHIARIAATVASRSKWALAQLFGRTVTSAMLAVSDKFHVAVLVESAEHARELAQLLPDWKLRTWTDEARRGLPINFTAQHSILTTTYAARKGTDAQILIRATGTSDPLHVRGFPPPADDTGRTHVLVIDFADEFHPIVVKKAGHRLASYERQGMTIVPAKQNTFTRTNWIIPGSYDAGHPALGGVRESRPSGKGSSFTLTPSRSSGETQKAQGTPSSAHSLPWDESVVDEDTP